VEPNDKDIAEYLTANGWRYDREDGAWFDRDGGWPDPMSLDEAYNIQRHRYLREHGGSSS
jgi:hypothetical protein